MKVRKRRGKKESWERHEKRGPGAYSVEHLQASIPEPDFYDLLAKGFEDAAFFYFLTLPSGQSCFHRL